MTERELKGAVTEREAKTAEGGRAVSLKAIGDRILASFIL